jgi:hypothetical protein
LDHWERLIFLPWVAVNNCSGCVVEFVVVGFVEILDAARNSESFARERDSMSFTCSCSCSVTKIYAHRYQPVAHRNNDLITV